MDENHSESPISGRVEDAVGLGLRFDGELLVSLVLIFLAFVSRFYDLEARVMSHDESLHTFYSWQFSEGLGYRHDPLMHGPLQFHLVSLSYTLFGDSDASSRFPVAAAGVLSVGLVLLFKRWLGRWGAITAAAIMLVSPFMLYYSRYVRNEAFVVLLALLMFYSVFRYSETRKAHWLYLLSASLALHFTAKETSFIYAAQLLLFLGAYFAWTLLSRPWPKERHRLLFLVGLVSAALGVASLLVMLFRERAPGIEMAQPAIPGAVSTLEGLASSPGQTLSMMLVLAGVVLIAGALILSFGSSLRNDFPTFDLLIIAGTMTLPLLAALPAKALGWNPMAYYDPVVFNKDWALILILISISTIIGVLWNWRRWLVAAGIFFGIVIFLYTSAFTNGDGLLSGFIGSLGYWLEQHGVGRGSQPWYYYLLVQIPVYEFLPAITLASAAVYGVFRVLAGEWTTSRRRSSRRTQFPAISFLVFWTLTALFAYTYAGEKMPWLTVHIVLPMILLAGWVVGKLYESTPWKKIISRNGLPLMVFLLIALLSLGRLSGTLLGVDMPFEGKQLDQLTRTNAFLASVALVVVSIIGLLRFGTGWRSVQILKLGGILIIGGFWALTARAATRAAFSTYDEATEFLVYAHSATGVKDVMKDVQELSVRTTGDLAIKVAYDDDVSWPFTWYLRKYSEQRYFGVSVGQDMLEYPLVIVGDNNWGRIDPRFEDRYLYAEFIRMWWPMQDYWNLTWPRILEILSSRAYRSALWDIWFDRNYEAYGRLRGIDLSLENWSPSDRMRFYIRDDFASHVWDYNEGLTSIQDLPQLEDPYEEGMISLSANLVIGAEGVLPGQFQKPRGIAVAPDGTIFVADTGNHRIQRFDSDGELISSWGTYANVDDGDAPGGTFNEPWGIAVSSEGSVYVADTWNFRIQMFSLDGEFIGMFGEAGQAETPFTLWGPRAVAVGEDGRVYVADTGNHRIVVLSPEMEPIGQFGVVGFLPGELSEPVGVAVDDAGTVYVADTWNQRIQVFEETEGGDHAAVAEWDLVGWYGDSLENKPYLTLSSDRGLCASDPESFRVLCFTPQGEFVMGWGSYGDSNTQFALLNGLAFDLQGQVWVVDSGNHRIMRFKPDILEDES